MPKHSSPRFARARAGDAIQQPLQLRAGEVGVGYEPGAVADHIAQTVRLQALHQRRGAAALPYDGVRERPSAVALPEQRGLALIGDADGLDVRSGDARARNGLLQRVHLTFIDGLRVVFHPAGLGIDLRKFDALRGDGPRRFVEYDGARAGGALIQSDDVLHAASSLGKLDEMKPAAARRSWASPNGRRFD